jgi:hypothetical protein
MSRKKTPMPCMKFKTGASVFTPYFDVWNGNAYTRREPFSEEPLRVCTSSTSGAPVVVAGSVFAGLLRDDVEARFSWDGATLSVEAPDGAVFVAENGDTGAAWEAYHRALGLPAPQAAPYGRMPEYCTWVEQVRRKHARGLGMVRDAQDERLVREMLDEVDKAGWPKGRFTVDDGWCPAQGAGAYGDWEPRAGIDIAKLAREIAAAGHVPGLWLAPALIDKDSRAARARPGLLGPRVQMAGEASWNLYHYLQPGEAGQALLDGLFRRVWDWGFRKLKLDIFYGPKPLMAAILAQCAAAARKLPGAVELEAHSPDPFLARHAHVVRLNDVLISPAHPGWREVVRGHWEVCSRGAPRHVLNLDHIGGNNPAVTEADFVEHCAMMLPQLGRGYPVVSLLPRHVGPGAVASVNDLLAAAAGAIVGKDRRHGRAAETDGASTF